MSFKRISVQQSADIIVNNTESNIVDTRDLASFQAGHIPNAITLNNDIIKSFVSNSDKAVPLLVCCYHGNSSQQAAAFFAEQGFSEVYSIDGGFEEWKLSQAIEK